MSEADDLIRLARERATLRAERHVPIDYARAKREFTKQKAALTRAINSGDRDKVVLACANAVREWNRPDSAWPDDWARWQRALDDVFPVFESPRLEDLA